MMLPETYLLESIDQLKALADELRQRIIHALAEPMTVTQLGDVLGIPPANLRYHVRELERLGLVRLVETREKSGILEKYYQTRARTLAVPSLLFSEHSPDATLSAVSGFLQDVSRGFLTSFARRAADRTPANDTAVTRSHLWMTDEEVVALRGEIEALVRRYQHRRGLDGERELTFVDMLYDPRAAIEGETAAPTITVQIAGSGPEDFTTPGRAARLNLERDDLVRSWVAGITTYGREDFQRIVDRGKPLDLVSIGHVTFEDDVPPDLVDRAIARFRHRGALSASPAVRDVLMRKGGDQGIQQ